MVVLVVYGCVGSVWLMAGSVWLMAGSGWFTYHDNGLLVMNGIHNSKPR